MIVTDALYGSFSLPEEIAALVLTPEVRRLSQIRLINSLSPSLSSIAEVRRYSHTLGVLHLAQLVQLTEYSAEEKKALAASVVLHDVGTHPFGHLMEYQLRERGWGSHEDLISRVLWANYAPENRAHQIQPGHTLQFRNTLRRNSISIDLVDAIVTNRHPLSLLLFGSLDLDNLDNVARMAFLLGIQNTASVATELARTIRITADLRLVLPLTAKKFVSEWSRLRRYSYETMLFDPPTMASQAVLYNAISLALDSGTISEDQWFLNDEQLIEQLRRDHKTKDAINLEYLGTPPALAFCIQVKGKLNDLGFRKREEGSRLIENVLKTELRSGSVLGYVVLDSGTFEKSLTFITPLGEEWDFGTKSESVIFYGFATALSTVSQARCRNAALQFLERIKIQKSEVLCFLVGPMSESILNNAQQPIEFETSEHRLGLRR